MLQPLAPSDIRVQDGFLDPRIDTARRISLPYMWDALNDRIEGVPPSHGIENLRIAARIQEGAHRGWVFQDSDVYKWLEAASLTLAHPDEALGDAEMTIAGVIDLIERAQMPDGYLDTYYSIDRAHERWTDVLNNHELYVAGHLMEAAAAHHRVTGRTELLDIARRLADHIDETFGPAESGKIPGYPGHEEVEIGLVKLYDETGERRYLNLAQFFLDERGKRPIFFDAEPGRAREERVWMRDQKPAPYAYCQAHKPVREQTEATGHAVRAGYLYTAMADVAARTGDEALLRAAKALWDDVARRQMYITGGVGSQRTGEAFSFDYDLPNDAMYNETCASIALMMFSQRLQRITREARYADVVERALYNGVLSGVSLDGTRYFYMNPLEVWPRRAEMREECSYVAERQGWFGCACCPPNLLRTLAGLTDYLCATDGDSLYVNLYAGFVATLALGGVDVTVTQSGTYPWSGDVRLSLSMPRDASFSLALRIPEWCASATLTYNGEALSIDALKKDGYAVVSRTFRDGDALALSLPMVPRRVYASDRCPADAGRVAVAYGPLVYCLEQIDNGEALWNLRLPDDAALTARFDPGLFGGAVRIEAMGVRESSADPEALYVGQPKRSAPQALSFVPYYAWGNRGVGEMCVWVRA